MKGTLSILLAALALSGCTLTARGFIPPPPSATVTVTASAPPPPSVNAQVYAQTPQVGAGVQVVQASCVQGAPEQCNGIDDNCNGQIDEGCGYQSGNIQITLAWQGGADLDLYVTDPMGQRLNWQQTSVSSGGQLDHDDRGACRSDGNDGMNVENVFWNSPQPPSGNYQVAVDYFSQCGVANVSPATLSISVGGRIVGSYSIQLQPGQRQFPIASFQL